MTPLPGGFHIDYRVLLVVKALLAASAVALLVWDLRFGAHAPVRAPRFRNRALAALGLLSLAAWWNFGALHGPRRPVHLHDTFHYYIGSKYYGELQYTRLYQCVAVAEIERGRLHEVSRRWTRNLATNELEIRVPGAVETEDCRNRFGSDRWKAFTVDVEWFWQHMRSIEWVRVQMDRGFNATPVWAAIGHWLAWTGPASNAQVLALTAIDSVLLLVMWAVVWRTFGWSAACVALIFWGLYESGGYAWLGGAFLRQDALFCVVCGVCALRAGRGMWAGAALAAATLLRAFPILLMTGIGINMIYLLRRDGTATVVSRYGRFAAGLLLAASMLLTFTAITWARTPHWGNVTEPWQGFAANSRKHLRTPSTNRLGLETLLSFSPSTRAAKIEAYWLDGPWDTWRSARSYNFEKRKTVYWIIVALFFMMFAVSVRHTEDWLLIVMAVAVLPIVANLSNYYYSLLLLFGLLWPRDKAVGVGLVAFAALTTILPAFFKMRDDRYVVASAALIAYVFWLVARRIRISRPATPPAHNHVERGSS